MHSAFQTTQTANHTNSKGHQPHSSTNSIDHNFHISSEICEAASSLDWRTLDERSYQSKAQRGPQYDFPYSMKSHARSLSGSSFRHQSPKDFANKLTRSNEFSGCTSCQSSLTCHNSSCLITKGCNAVNSSDLCIDGSTAKNATTKSSRKKKRRKGKKNKKDSLSTRLTEPEVLFDYAHRSVSSENFSYNDHGDDFVSYAASPEVSMPKGSINKIKGNSDGFNCSGSPLPYKLNIDEFDIAENTISSVVQNYPCEHSVINLDAGIQEIDKELSILDGVTEITCYDDMTKSLSNTPDSLVLDSISLRSSSNNSIHSNHEVKPFDADNSGVYYSESSRVNPRKVYLSDKNLLDGIVHLLDYSKETEHHIQNFGGSDMQFLVPGKREKQMKTLPRSSNFYKFGSSRTGKENIHSVWQKVQRNDCNCQLKKVPIGSQVGAALQLSPSLKRNCNVALANASSTPEDKKQPKNKVSKKLKKKSGQGSKGECYSNNGRGSRSRNPCLNTHAKTKFKDNEILGISAQVNNKKKVKCVSKLHTQSGGSEAGCHNNKAECVNSDTLSILPISPDVQEPLESNCDAFSGAMDGHTENLCEVQPLVDLPHPSCDKLSHIGNEISLECTRKNRSSVSTLQRWIPIGVKVAGLTKFGSSPFDCLSELSEYWSLRDTVEKKVISNSQDLLSSLTLGVDKERDASCLSHKDNSIKMLSNTSAIPEQNINHVTASCLTSRLKSHNLSASEVESSKILQAVDDSYRIQLTSEAVQIAIGGPIAEFERFLHFSAPVICHSPSLLCYPTCLPDQHVDVALCSHKTPILPLRCLWQWYEKHGIYGLEIKAEDYEYSRRLGVDHGKFRAYFVPYLSAVQLFKSHKPQCMRNSSDYTSHGLVQTCEIGETSDDCSTGLPILSAFVPRPLTSDESKSVKTTWSNDTELHFEYFESDQPQRRQPLYEKIQALVRGDVVKQGKMYGDPTNLASMNVHDLHPRSWYSVAWYPIYRIPDDTFRAAFLTYHSLGHLVCRGTKFDSLCVDACIVSPVVGLQSYNSQNECWFHLRQSVISQTRGAANRILKERLRTLEKTASVMATATVNKGNDISVNRHPDYEFFLSRKSY